MPQSFWPSGKRCAVSLSFDDARPSQIDHGIPILDRHNVKATFYVTIRGVEQRLDGWRRAIANGHEIGNHTLTHPCSGNFPFSRKNALEDFTLERIERDIRSANEQIQTLLGVTPTTFAYPCGQTYVGRGAHLNSYIPVIARHFLVGRSAFDETPNHPEKCDLAQAFAMDGDLASMDKLKSMLDMAIADAGWLILLAHDVGEGSKQCMRPDVLDEFCAHLNSQPSIWNGTVEQIARYIKERRGT